MKISVVGTGYVGLVSGTCFAETGHQVTCIDIDEQKVESLNSGKLTIYEPGLQTIFERNTKAGRLTFTTSLAEGIKGSKVIFLALPTPPGADGSADLKYILGVAKDLSPLLTNYTVIVDKSTVPVGTAEKVAAILSEGVSDKLFDVVSNPEFLREGVAVDDFLKPDRIVIGTKSPMAKDIMNELYKPFIRQGNPIFFMDERSAEMTKYAANSYLATRISFMNEIANICDKVGANVDSVRLGMGSDTRIGKRFLFPGVGYGGSCFPKDVQALERTSSEYGYDFKILKAVTSVNDGQKLKVFEKLKEVFGESLKDKKVGIWGLAFKPNTDDIREAPSLFLIDDLIKIGCEVKVFDPEAMNNVQDIYGDKITFSISYTEASTDIDILVIMTEWAVFRNPDFDHMLSNIKDKVIFDGRNLYDPLEMKAMGFKYYSIGRPLDNQ